VVVIDWTRIENALARLACAAPAARLLSVSLPLPRAPALTLHGDWCVWQRPEQGLRLTGIGKAFCVHSAGEGRFAALAAAQRGLVHGWRHVGGMPRAFAGFAFAPHGGDPLPNAALWAPEMLIAEQPDQTMLTFSCAAGQAARAPARWRMLWQEATQRAAVPPAPSFQALPNALSDQAFLARGRAALAAIAAGRADKLVLTRSVRLQADRPAAIAPLIEELARHHPACAIFGVGAPGFAFVGASPETLVKVDGAQVAVDALAGTAWGDLKLQSEKNRREHDFVAQAVVAALAGACSDVTLPDAPEALQLEALAHLRRRVTARRAADIGVFDLIARLHPTPAVGGFPTPAALDWLARHQDTRGAWYTGAIGWLDARGDADFAVCLRCGLLEAQRVALYAGAGFVAGADPEQELAETEAKLAAMRAALAAAARRAEQAA